MTHKENFDYAEFELAVTNLTSQILGHKKVFTNIYSVANGGNVLATALAERLGIPIWPHLNRDCLIVEDIIDSGRTLSKLFEKHHDQPRPHIACLHFNERSSVPAQFYWKKQEKGKEAWINYFWEKSSNGNIEENVTRILEFIGEDPTREGIVDTPARVVKSWRELYSGYSQKPEDHLSKCFVSESKGVVVCKDIEFYSMCEHHMLPFVGKAHVGYAPDGVVVGLSKLARVVDLFARRMQIQENFTTQIAQSLMDHIPGCKGAGVIIEAKHYCMCARGVNKDSIMVTESLLGEFALNTSLQKSFFRKMK